MPRAVVLASCAVALLIIVAAVGPRSARADSHDQGAVDTAAAPEQTEPPDGTDPDNTSTDPAVETEQEDTPLDAASQPEAESEREDDPSNAAAEPQSQPTQASADSYIVQPGDWVARIAEENGVTVADIVRLNPEVVAPDYLIHPGQVLVLREALEPQAVPEAVEPEPLSDDASTEETPQADASLSAVEEPEEPEPSVAAVPSTPITISVAPAVAVGAEEDDGRGLALDIGIGVAGLATGVALALGGPWLRRWRRGY